MSPPVPGQRIANRYVLEGRIGSGGHGEIWSAMDEQEGRRVVLKFLRDDLATSVEAWAVLNHESQMARRLNHPGILRTGTPLRDRDRTVLPMEYAGGGDLKRLRGQSYLRSVPVLIRIAEILAHAHSRGVIHRDLKPGNVLFDERGEVRLADFGAAGLTGSRRLHAQGSPFSASPQQLRDLPASPADDIYGLGALAYELLSGYPPYYPDFSTERVLNEPVPPLVPVQPAPQGLVDLVMRMLEHDPAKRPPTMVAVIEQLNQSLMDTLAVEPTEPHPVIGGLDLHEDATQVVPSLPVIEHDSTLHARRHVAEASRALPVALWMGVAGLVALAGVAGWWLVQRTRGADVQVAVASEPGSSSPGTASTPPVGATSADAATLARRFEEKLAALEARDAGSWGGPDFAAARNAAEQARRALADGSDGAARSAYAQALEHLERVEDGMDQALASAMAAGQRAIELGQEALARQSFERALRIAPGNAAAMAGLEQATRLREALVHLAEGVQAEATGNASLALRAYGEALRLAPGLQAAAEAQVRLARTRTAGEYARQMARGYEARKAGRYTDARRAFERALALQPGDEAARAALAQIEDELAANDFEALRREGASLEAQERWREAEETWRRALEKDPSLRFAQQGVKRAGERAELSDRLDDYLQRPERFESPEVRAEAERWIQHARQLEGGPVLRSQVDRIELQLAQYTQPVPVHLASDGATEVSILRVGSLGAFDSRSISLPPGEYTIVGRRPGYRDVRRELRIEPSVPPPAVMVACTEPVN